MAATNFISFWAALAGSLRPDYFRCHIWTCANYIWTPWQILSGPDRAPQEFFASFLLNFFLQMQSEVPQFYLIMFEAFDSTWTTGFSLPTSSKLALDETPSDSHQCQPCTVLKPVSMLHARHTLYISCIPALVFLFNAVSWTSLPTWDTKKLYPPLFLLTYLLYG